MARKVFTVPGEFRPPEEFEFAFHVREQEKYNAGTEEEPDWQMRDVAPERVVKESRIFHARMTSIPGKIAKAASVPPADDDDTAGAARWSNAVDKVLQIAVVEWEEFNELLESTRTIVPMEYLMEVVRWVLEETGQRPTNGPAR